MASYYETKEPESFLQILDPTKGTLIYKDGTVPQSSSDVIHNISNLLPGSVHGVVQVRVCSLLVCIISMRTVQIGSSS